MPDAGGHPEPLLALIGSRVRAARKARRMTRKALAANSAVSERHLAQLEGGLGNISVLLLARIATAIDEPLSALVATPLASTCKARRIALIGLRGAGKSTLGRAAADALGMPFAELNDGIAAAAGLSPGEIFALYGEDGYRRFEATALAQIANTEDSIVLATGGGIVTNKATWELLLARFHSVWLTATPEEHMARVVAQGDHRPMAGDPYALDSMRAILASRNAQYSSADAVLETAGLDVGTCVQNLIATIRSRVGG